MTINVTYTAYGENAGICVVSLPSYTPNSTTEIKPYHKAFPYDQLNNSTRRLRFPETINAQTFCVVKLFYNKYKPIKPYERFITTEKNKSHVATGKCVCYVMEIAYAVPSCYKLTFENEHQYRTGYAALIDCKGFTTNPLDSNFSNRIFYVQNTTAAKFIYNNFNNNAMITDEPSLTNQFKICQNEFYMLMKFFNEKLELKNIIDGQCFEYKESMNFNIEKYLKQFT